MTAACQAADLSRLGVNTGYGPQPQNFEDEVDADTGLTLPGITTQSIPHRIMSFLLCVCEARCWNCAWKEWVACLLFKV